MIIEFKDMVDACSGLTHALVVYPYGSALFLKLGDSYSSYYCCMSISSFALSEKKLFTSRPLAALFDCVFNSLFWFCCSRVGSMLNNESGSSICRLFPQLS